MRGLLLLLLLLNTALSEGRITPPIQHLKSLKSSVTYAYAGGEAQGVQFSRFLQKYLPQTALKKGEERGEADICIYNIYISIYVYI